MKSNITKMITMCMCMMVVGFAAEEKQSIHAEKELQSIPAKQQIVDKKNANEMILIALFGKFSNASSVCVAFFCYNNLSRFRFCDINIILTSTTFSSQGVE